MDFAEASNTPIQGGKVVNTSYLLILRAGGTEKACENWEDMQVGLKTWQAFKGHFSQAYRSYQIRKKVNRGGPWVWDGRKSYTRNRCPS